MSFSKLQPLLRTNPLRCLTSSSLVSLRSVQWQRQRGRACFKASAVPLGLNDRREEEGAAAGICFYCYSKKQDDLCVLMLREDYSKRSKEVAWTWPGGKRKWGTRFKETLRATAARETEEETHRQLTAERVEPMLDACQHIVWWADGKYSLFLVHLPNEWEVADAILRKVQAKEQHPEALALSGAAWVPLQTLVSMARKWRSQFEGFPLHRVPRGIINQTEVTDILLAELQSLRLEDTYGTPHEKAHSLESSKDMLGTSAVSAVPGETAALSEQGAGSTNSSAGSAPFPSQSSHSAAAPDVSRSKDVPDRSHTDRMEDRPQTDSTGSWQKPRDPLEALSIRRAHGNTPILWPQGVPVSSPQLLPKPQRSIIPSANRQGSERQ